MPGSLVNVLLLRFRLLPRQFDFFEAISLLSSSNASLHTNNSRQLLVHIFSHGAYAMRLRDTHPQPWIFFSQCCYVGRITILAFSSHTCCSFSTTRNDGPRGLPLQLSVGGFPSQNHTLNHAIDKWPVSVARRAVSQVEVATTYTLGVNILVTFTMVSVSSVI